jgi:two-component system sensor histidine kinase VicK
MFKSIKTSAKVMVLVLVITTFVAVNILVNYSLTGKFGFSINLPIVVTFFMVLLLSMLLMTAFYKNILTPMKKLERSMKNLRDGKNVDSRHLANVTKLEEMQQLINSYSEILNSLLKNRFELDSQESKTSVILNRMDDGVIAFSMQKQVIHINGAAKSFADISDADDTYDKIMKKLKLKVDFDKVLYLSNYKNLEEKVEVNDNVLSVVLVPYHNEKLLPMGVIAILKNITENEKLNNMRKEFVANVSHELKTPLCSIKGYSETMMDRDLEPEEIKKFAKVINDEANRMDRIVADLLQLSRFDYKKNVWDRNKLNIDDLAKQVVENLQYVAKEKKHNLKCVVNMIPGPVLASKDAIQQVMTNIISNSIKYTPDGGEITVYVGAAGGKAYLKFVDNGIGIPEKDLKRIFERFYRVDKARSRQMGGTGLGLSIVKEIVEAHEGTIEMKSEEGV